MNNGYFERLRSNEVLFQFDKIKKYATLLNIQFAFLGFGDSNIKS